MSRDNIFQDNKANGAGGSSSNNHHVGGGPSRINGGSMIATREPLGSYAEHLKYTGAGSAQISGAAQAQRSSSYVPRAPASSHGHGPLSSQQRGNQ